MISLHFPCFVTVTEHGYGFVVPSELRTVTVITRVVVEGRGSDRYMNGSNVTDIFLQMGQINVDRYWPCNTCNKSQKLNSK